MTWTLTVNGVDFGPPSDDLDDPAVRVLRLERLASVGWRITTATPTRITAVTDFATVTYLRTEGSTS